jgi:hypothetical protein
MTELERAIEAKMVAHAAVRDFDHLAYADDYTASVAYLRVIKRKREIDAWVEACPVIP